MILSPLLKRTKVAALLSLSLLGAWFSASGQNPTATPANPRSSERFLLVVETSSGMKPRATNLLQTVGRLFSAGLNGQLHVGDTIGVWTYDSDLHAGKFPLQHWTPQNMQEVTATIVQFLQQQGYDQPAGLAPVMGPMTNIVARSDKITVLLISDGSEAPAGMPFDTQIADAYKLNAAAQQAQAMPFVTIWRAERGEFTGFMVSTPPGLVEFPAFATNLVPVAPAVASSPVPNLIVINHDSPPATNPPVKTNTTTPTPAQTTQTVAAVTTPAPGVSSIATAPVEKTNPAPAPPRESPAIPAQPKSKLPLIPILIGVIVVTAGLVFFCLAKLKSSRAAPRTSLITHTMNEEEK
jgi:hypothetical protein